LIAEDHDYQRKYLTLILNEAGYEVLDLAKIEAGQISISLEPIDGSGAIKHCVNMMKNLIEQDGIELVNNLLANGMPWIAADLTRFKQVFINLLSNALKCDREKGTITLDFTAGVLKRNGWKVLASAWRFQRN